MFFHQICTEYLVLLYKYMALCQTVNAASTIKRNVSQ